MFAQGFTKVAEYLTKFIYVPRLEQRLKAIQVSSIIYQFSVFSPIYSNISLHLDRSTITFVPNIWKISWQPLISVVLNTALNPWPDIDEDATN